MGAAWRREAPFPENAAASGQLSCRVREQHNAAVQRPQGFAPDHKPELGRGGVFECHGWAAVWLHQGGNVRRMMTITTAASANRKPGRMAFIPSRRACTAMK